MNTLIIKPVAKPAITLTIKQGVAVYELPKDNQSSSNANANAKSDLNIDFVTLIDNALHTGL